MSKLIFSLFLLLFSTLTQAESVSQAPIDKITAQLDQYIQQKLIQTQIPGAAVAVVYKDKIVFMNEYGVRSLKTNEPVDQHTVFRLGSVSKAFAAELMGIMVEQKKIQWDDKVITYLPDFKLHDPQNTQKLTIRDIMSQRTGLPMHSGDVALNGKTSLADAIAGLEKVPLICNVGECYAYQNVTYSMSGLILQKVMQQDYAQLLKHYIFQPLRMTDATVTYEGLISNPNHTDCHEIIKNGKMALCPISSFSYQIAPAGGVNASITDMAEWLRAQMGAYPQVISPTVLKTVQTPEIASPDEMTKAYDPWRKDRVLSASYGLGWRIFDYAGTPVVYHGGALRGTGTVIAFIPQEQVGIVFLNNTSEAFPGFVVARFLDLYLNIPTKDWPVRPTFSPKKTGKTKKGKGKKKNG